MTMLTNSDEQLLPEMLKIKVVLFSSLKTFLISVALFKKHKLEFTATTVLITYIYYLSAK